MRSYEAVLAGVTIGLTVAAPIGPMAVIVIHRTLANGFLAGFASGAGASTIHLLYAILSVLGVTQLSGGLEAYRVELHAVTAALLIALAVRNLRRFTKPVPAVRLVPRSFLANYASAIAFNCVNPFGFVLLLGAVGAITGFARDENGSALGLAAGVFLGSIGWWVVLVSATTLVGLRLSPERTRFIDLTTATMLLVLAASMTIKLL